MEKNENRTNIFSLLQFSCQPFSVQSPQDFLIHLWLVYLVTHAVDISPRYLPSCPALWNRWTSDLHPACWQWSCRLYYMEKHLLVSCWILRLLLVPEKKKKKKNLPCLSLLWYPWFCRPFSLLSVTTPHSLSCQNATN